MFTKEHEKTIKFDEFMLKNHIRIDFFLFDMIYL